MIENHILTECHAEGTLELKHPRAIPRLSAKPVAQISKSSTLDDLMI
jgi:hypothetical protein